MGLCGDDLKSKMLCEYHFESKYFTLNRRNLLRTAVPIRFDESQFVLKLNLPSTSYVAAPLAPSPVMDGENPEEAVEVDFENFPKYSPKRKLSSLDDSEQVKKLKKELIAAKRNLAVANQRVRRLSKRLTTTRQQLQVRKYINSINFTSAESKIICEMQMYTGKRHCWPESHKKFAIALYYKSPAAYKYLRRFKIVLPGVSTVKLWNSSSKVLPGFQKTILRQLKLKSKRMTEMEQLCVISFDEMYIKPLLTYSPKLDLIEGFHDLGVIGRRNILGQHILVFMIRGIYSGWKIPFAYFVTGNAIAHKYLKPLIEKAVKKVFAAGFKPIALTCDQGTNNCAALKNLGVTTGNPFFYIDEKKIFSIFDVPHLFKNIRNNWLRHDFEDGKGNNHNI